MTIAVQGGEISAAEQLAYVAYIEGKHQRKIESLRITVEGDEVELEYVFAVAPFERIRRITGYLVGTLDRWNNAKAAEEHDRVKHSV